MLLYIILFRLAKIHIFLDKIQKFKTFYFFYHKMLLFFFVHGCCINHFFVPIVWRCRLFVFPFLENINPMPLLPP